MKYLIVSKAEVWMCCYYFQLRYVMHCHSITLFTCTQF